MPRLPAPTSIGSLTRAIRRCNLEGVQRRTYAQDGLAEFDKLEEPIFQQQSVEVKPRGSVTDEQNLIIDHNKKYRLPTKGFRTGQVVRQNHPINKRHSIPIIPTTMRSRFQICKSPIDAVTQKQLAVLDPTGERERLFARDNRDRVRPGDVVLVRLKSGDPFSGVVLNIRQVHSKVDWAILLRNHLTRVGVEMWYKIFSPNVEGIEIVQRKAKRARRNKLYYMRKPKHDMGSLEGIVRQYTLAKAGVVATKKGKKGLKGR